MNTKKIVARAKSSSFYLWLLNIGLNGMIPFNKPHGFKIIDITDTSIKTYVPYKKRNFNHIKGIHACALATLSEFTTGFLLVSRLDPKQYRIIMPRLEMEYHYQAKYHAYAEFEITDNWLNDKIYKPLESNGSALVICTIKTYDEKNNELTTGKVHWHIKPWSRVKTKV